MHDIPKKRSVKRGAVILKSVIMLEVKAEMVLY